MHNSVPLGRALRRAAGSGRGVLTLSWSASTTRSVDPDAPAASRPSHTWRRLPELGCANHTPIPSSRTRARKADAHASGGGASSGCGRPIGGFPRVTRKAAPQQQPRSARRGRRGAGRERRQPRTTAAHPGWRDADARAEEQDPRHARRQAERQDHRRGVRHHRGRRPGAVQAQGGARRPSGRSAPGLSRVIARVPRPGGPDWRPSGPESQAWRRACAPRVALAARATWPAQRAAQAPRPSSGRRAQSVCVARRR